MTRHKDHTEPDNETLLTRRGCLTLTGAAIASTAGFSGLASGNDAQYDTVTVGEGESKQFTLGGGETLENLIIDITSTDADAQIVAEGNDWTIRNVGVRGSTDVGNFEGGFSNLVKPSGNGLIEHCYFGDGVSRDGMRKGAIGPPSSHSGNITIRKCYIAEWPDNGIYSAHCASSGGGTVHVDGCFLRDNNVAQMRVASDGTVVENTVTKNTGNVPELPGGLVHSKGIYTGYGDPDQVVEVRNCQFDQRHEITDGPDSASAIVSEDNSSNGPSSTVQVSDTETLGEIKGPYVEMLSGNGNNPDTGVPSGVPTDAATAASGTESTTDSDSTTSDSSSTDNSTSDGSTSDGSSTDDSTSDGSTDSTASYEKLLYIDGTSKADVTARYHFTVMGSVAKDQERSTLSDGGLPWDTLDDTVQDGKVVGIVGNGVDVYRYSGEIVAINIRGKADFNIKKL